jgi:integral membrane protein
VPDYADDPVTEAERMAKALKVVALVETVSYLLLAYFWLVAQSANGTKIVGSVHGIVWMAFVAMVVLIKPKIGWSWGYVVLVVLTGPIGGVLVFARLQTEGVPEEYRSTPNQRPA